MFFLEDYALADMHLGQLRGRMGNLRANTAGSSMNEGQNVCQF